MKIKLVYILLIISSVSLWAQKVSRLAVNTGAETYYVPVYQREGTVYFSVRHFAEALDINYYVNPDTKKLELKFDNYNLKITPKNPFLVLYSKSEKTSDTYQLPTSTYYFDGHIFIPLSYSLKILRKASGRQMKFDPPGKLVVYPPAAGEIAGKKSPEVISKNLSEPGSSAFNIYGINIDEKANGTLVEVKSNKRIKRYNSNFREGVLSIVFRGVNVDAKKIDMEKAEGLIKKIEAENIGEDTELKFYLNREYTTHEVLNAPEGNDILITLHNKIFARNNHLEKSKAKWDFDVIVIDAGHGGKDYGAIGVGGVREKDINLGIALKLGRLIQKNMKDVKVVYTRSSDKFVELYKRGKIANEKNGKLFISIHCNSTPRKTSSATGFEVYLLRPGRTKEAIDIAERENSVIQYEDNPQRYQELTDENFILVSMAQSAYMKYSEKFSDLLNKEFEKDLTLDSRGVKQAGFYVLVGASMPSVLVETGFLSNPHDARYLKSSSGQSKIAAAIYKAIREFRKQYEKALNSE